MPSSGIAYRNDPAWEFERFLDIAGRGKPRPAPPRAANPEAARQKEREDLEASIEYTRKLLYKERTAMNRRQFIQTSAAGLSLAAAAYAEQAADQKPKRVGLIGDRLVWQDRSSSA